jgi:hypothetical protein
MGTLLAFQVETNHAFITLHQYLSVSFPINRGNMYIYVLVRGPICILLYIHSRSALLLQRFVFSVQQSLI